jgi:hypothetical protein
MFLLSSGTFEREIIEGGRRNHLLAWFLVFLLKIQLAANEGGDSAMPPLLGVPQFGCGCFEFAPLVR